MACLCIEMESSTRKSASSRERMAVAAGAVLLAPFPATPFPETALFPVAFAGKPAGAAALSRAEGVAVSGAGVGAAADLGFRDGLVAGQTNACGRLFDDRKGSGD